jgi:cell wall-associated NlpC family hydrolase
LTILQVKAASTSVKSKIGNKIPLDNEFLFGEKVNILKKKDNFYFCESLLDNYKGWVSNNDLGELTVTTHRVINLRTCVFRDSHEKSEILIYIPCGSKLSVIDHNKKWAKIIFPYDKETIYGFVPLNHIVKNNHIEADWVSVAEQFLNTPYRWGGRDSIGVDCSALIQLSLETKGKIFPRDTKLQILIQEQKSSLDTLNRGSIIFWDGHVGVMTDKKNLIHSNAFHMKTLIEPLKKVNARAKDNNKEILKIININ